MKRINEAFSDYESGKNIGSALVESGTLKKNTKTMEMVLRSDKYIGIDEIEGLNRFIKERFSLKDSKIM